MLLKKKKNNVLPGTIDTVIGPNTIINGDIDAKGTLRIEGRIQGNISVTGDISIGKNAYVLGNIYARNIEVHGTVEGNIYAEGLLKISVSAKLFGDVEVESFVSDQGSFFEGKCTMREPLPDDDKIKVADNNTMLIPFQSDYEESIASESNNTQNYKKSSLLGDDNSNSEPEN